MARSLASVHDQRKEVAAQVEEILDARPLARVLISMPGFGIRTAARVLFLAAFSSLSSPPSRACYDRKRAEGKKHNAALICFARRRSDVIYVMLRDRPPYQPPLKITAQNPQAA
jgi:hypothetical protein